MNFPLKHMGMFVTFDRLSLPHFGCLSLVDIRAVCALVVIRAAWVEVHESSQAGNIATIHASLASCEYLRCIPEKQVSI